MTAQPMPGGPTTSAGGARSKTWYPGGFPGLTPGSIGAARPSWTLVAPVNSWPRRWRCVARRVTGIDPAAGAVAAARQHAQTAGYGITYDVGVGEALLYKDAAFDAVVCVDVLEHVTDLTVVLAEVARVLRPGGLFLFDTVNRNPIARFATITVAEDLLRLLPRVTHDPALFIKPAELRRGLTDAGLVPGPFTGLGPRGLNRRGELSFGRLPLTTILYMGTARKPAMPRPKRHSQVPSSATSSKWRPAIM